MVNSFPNEHVLGIYEEEIKTVSMLGIDGTLDWQVNDKGLVIKIPANKPCDHAYVFKIEKH